MRESSALAAARIGRTIGDSCGVKRAGQLVEQRVRIPQDRVYRSPAHPRLMSFTSTSTSGPWLRVRAHYSGAWLCGRASSRSAAICCSSALKRAHVSISRAFEPGRRTLVGRCLARFDTQQVGKQRGRPGTAPRRLHRRRRSRPLTAQPLTRRSSSRQEPAVSLACGFPGLAGCFPIASLEPAPRPA